MISEVVPPTEREIQWTRGLCQQCGKPGMVRGKFCGDHLPPGAVRRVTPIDIKALRGRYNGMGRMGIAQW